MGVTETPDYSQRSSMDIQCLPLYSLIQAAGNPRVNLLVLDTLGNEGNILLTIPFDKVNIDTIMVSVDREDSKGEFWMRGYLRSRNYTDSGLKIFVGDDKRLVYTKN